MLNFIRDGELWVNVTLEHEENNETMDPTDFRWSCGLSSKHFHLAYDERSWYFSPRAYKKWKENNELQGKDMTDIFRDLFLGCRR